MCLKDVQKSHLLATGDVIENPEIKTNLKMKKMMSQLVMLQLSAPSLPLIQELFL